MCRSATIASPGFGGASFDMPRLSPPLIRAAWGALLLLAIGCAPGAGGEADDAPADVGPSDGQPGDAQPGDAQADDASTADTSPPAELGDTPRFAFPVAAADRAQIHPGLFFGVDHDPVDGDAIECLAYDGRGFPFCYDGHEGSDFVLNGGFRTMDAGSALVVAAAGGEVVIAVDGHYDRCSGDLQSFEPSCDGHPIRSNTVVIEHAHGWRTRYLHLMRGSVAVRVGDRVECDTPLGRVGSSGRSFTPHLHFEVLDPRGEAIDPFAGTINGPRTLWVEQRADDDLPGPACDAAWGPIP